MIFRTVGSIDVVGAVRSVITVVPDPDDKDKWYMVMSKSNLAHMGSAISFIFGEEGITFFEELDTTADELLSRLSGFSPVDRLSINVQNACVRKILINNGAY